MIFSLGMYIGIDKSSPVSSVQNQSAENNTYKQEEVEETDREQIIEEVHASHVSVDLAEPTVLQEIAYGGERIVKNTFDQLIQVTHTFVEGIF